MKRHYRFVIVLFVFTILCSIVWAAGTIKKSWATATDIFSTNAFGGAKADVNTVEQYSTSVDLATNGYAGAHITVEADATGTTDSLYVYVYSAIDDANFDETPLTQLTIAGSTASPQMSFVLKDIAGFKIGAKSSGGTNTFGVEIKCRPWRWYYE